MATLRSQSWAGQQRVDVPHLKAIESAVSADFDVFAGQMFSGQKSLVLKGLVIPTANTVGTQASLLQLNTAGSLICHFNGSESGTIFTVPVSQAAEVLTSTNPNVVGSFVANATNYVGLDFNRNPDSTTSDIVQFLDADTDLEVPETIPLARTLQYKILISTQSFSSSQNILPIAKVVTDSNNNVSTITDVRQMMFRLGSGGDGANALNTYPWGTRNENNIVYNGGTDSFTAEDKNISNLKSAMDAILTSIWEVRGGEFWYAPALRDNVKLAYGQPVLGSNSDNFDYNSGTSTLTWSGLTLIYENALDGTTYYNSITPSSGIGGGTGLVINDGQCLYVDLVRESNATTVPNVVNLTTLGTSTIPGRRMILAWRKGSLVFTRDRPYEIGRALQVATTTVLGVVKLSRTASTPLAPIVISDQGGTIIAAAASNNDALDVTGNGTGSGITATGGTNGTGGFFNAGGGNNAGGVGQGAGSGDGLQGTGGATGHGVNGQGGATSGAGGIFTANGGNSDGVDSTGHGSGAGINSVGGGTSGTGAVGVGGAPNGDGVHGSGSGSGGGVSGFGGNSSGTGVTGIGGVTDGIGVSGQGQGAGSGVFGAGGATAAGGVFQSGNGANADGVVATALAGNARGVHGTGHGGTGTYGVDGAGVRGDGGATGAGVVGLGGATSGPGIFGGGGGTSSPGGVFANSTAATNNARTQDILCTAGDIRFVGVTNPAANPSTPIPSNSITTNSFCKFHASMSVSNAGAVTVLGGLNISNGTPPSTTTTALTVTFGTSMSGPTTYTAIATIHSPTSTIFTAAVTTKNNGSLVITPFNTSAVVQNWAGNGTILVDVYVIGIQ